ncbi:hypothetical protein BGX38DRAFT_1276004 [Terfezia claveryi]|nr:hypothetical protein BGX38DRAFT_1276004 [Terfezia claveryi]
MRYWWRNTGMETRLSHEYRLEIEDLTGKLPILLNVLNQPVKAKDQGGVEDMQDLFHQLLGRLVKSNEVVSMQPCIHDFGECQKEKYKDLSNIGGVDGVVGNHPGLSIQAEIINKKYPNESSRCGGGNVKERRHQKVSDPALNMQTPALYF